MVEDILGIGKAFEIPKEVINLAKYIYEEYVKHRSVKNEEMSKFLDAALEALRETLRYMGRVPYTRDPGKEGELSDLWAKVATTARPFNPDVAQRCFLKSSYWANPERWTDRESKAAKISIAEMEVEIGKLFSGRQQKGK